jgi:hypothetical protein
MYAGSAGVGSGKDAAVTPRPRQSAKRKSTNVAKRLKREWGIETSIRSQWFREETT